MKKWWTDDKCVLPMPVREIVYTHVCVYKGCKEHIYSEAIHEAVISVFNTEKLHDAFLL